MLLIDFIKFIHLLTVLSLLGLMVYCLILVGSTNIAAANSNLRDTLKPLTRSILWLSLFAIVTGTLLVYPKQYTFHTHWIQAAYVLMFFFAFGITQLKKYLLKNPQQPISKWSQRIGQLGYLMLIIILVLVVHDAVTKITFF